MARPLEFDKNVALDAAMEQFWREGYEASSIQKLLDVMGINRGSLYSSFGDKESLFKVVLDRYEQIVDQHIRVTLLEMEDPIEAINQFLSERYRKFPKRKISNGCLFVNTVNELTHTEPGLARLVARKQNEIEMLIAKRLEEAQRKGFISSDVNCGTLAGFVLVVIGGLNVRSKQSPDKKQLMGIIDLAMKAVA